MNRNLILSSVALLALAACGEAEDATTTAESTATDVAADTTATVENAPAAVTDAVTPAADTRTANGYATAAALGDMFEIESSRIAVEKAKSPEVKQFAQMMIDGHSKTTAELKSALGSAGVQVTLPAALDERRQEMITELRGKSATDFDTAYLDQQSRAHGESLDLHRTYADAGDNAPLKAFAAKTAPIVQQHIDMAKKLDKSGADEPAANPPQK
jgi:putative membrane protein